MKIIEASYRIETPIDGAEMLKRRMEQGKELPLAWGDGRPETVMKWWLEN